MKKRLKQAVKEPSTLAGIGICIDAVTKLYATKGADSSAWGQLAFGVAAMAIREKALVNVEKTKETPSDKEKP